MVDTFRPLELGEAGLAVEDPAYAWTWAGRGPDTDVAAAVTTVEKRRRSRGLQQQLKVDPDSYPVLNLGQCLKAGNDESGVTSSRYSGPAGVCATTTKTPVPTTLAGATA